MFMSSLTKAKMLSGDTFPNNAVNKFEIKPERKKVCMYEKGEVGVGKGGGVGGQR